MRVLLTAWGSRGDLQPLAALALRVRELGAEVRVCAPPDEEFVELFARVGATLIPLGPSTRSVAAGLKAPSPDAAFKLAAELVAARFDALPAAAEGCDAIVATGLMPAGARDVAQKLGIRYVLATFHIFGLPSRHFAPAARPGRQSPAGETDNRALWAQDAERVNALYPEPLNWGRAAIGLPPVDNVRDHVLTDQVWLAADPLLAPWKDLTDLDIVQTGAWILTDDRQLPIELEAFLDAGEPPVYVGFGSMAMRTSPHLARVAIEAARAHGRRIVLGRGWADLALTDAPADCLVVGDVSQQVLSRASPPSCTTAGRARRRPPPWPARRRSWCPRSSTSRTGRAGWPSSASARRTTAPSRHRSPSGSRSGRPWPRGRAHARPWWPPRCAPTGPPWPRGGCSSRDEAEASPRPRGSLSRLGATRNVPTDPPVWRDSFASATANAGLCRYPSAMADRPAGIVSYFTAIEKKHGKPIDYRFAVLEPHRDLAHMEMVRLLKADYGMGHGHANAVVGTFRAERGIG